MNIIIVGAGEIGRHLAAVLSRESHTVSVIDKDEAIVAELEHSIDAKVIHGNGSSVQALVDADVGECDLFLSLSSSNTANLVSASMARSMGAGKVVCRVHPSLQREEWLFDFKGHFGIDHLFSSERLTAVELAKYVRNPDSLAVEELARGRIELQQLRVAENCGLVGKSLRKLALPEGIRIAMVSNGKEHRVPDADSELAAGDVVTIFGEPIKLLDVSRQLLGGRGRGERMRVVIFGGDEYGFSLAQTLEAIQCDVRIIEKDAVLCGKLADRLTNTTILCADATMASVLEEEQVGEADFFVATSAVDEDNVMSCLQAHTLGAATCLALIHRTDYAAVISSSGGQLGIRAAVSPREATRREIQRFITPEKFHIVQSFAGADLVEIDVARGSIAAGHMIREVDWPPGVVIVGHMRGIHAQVPGANEVLLAGDHVFAMVANGSMKRLARLLES